MDKVDLQLRNQKNRRNQSNWSFLISRRDVWLPTIFFVGISLILAARVLYMAPDDGNYITWFEGVNTPVYKDWWLDFIDEPLWVAYTIFISNIFDAETSLRITIFFSSLMFLISSNKLARGAWIFVFLAFVLDPSISAQIYYNHIREGVALSVFLAIVAAGLNPVWGALTASAIHSSFLFVIPCAIAANYVKQSRIRLVVSIFTIAISIFYFRHLILVSDIDLGRRTETYALEGVLSIFFYVVLIFQYGSVFIVLRNENHTEQQKYWFRFSLIFSIFVLCLGFVYEPAARLMCISNSLIMILLGMSLKNVKQRLAHTRIWSFSSLWLIFKRERTKIIAALWLLLLFSTQVNESTKVDFDQDSWFGRWDIILFK